LSLHDALPICPITDAPRTYRDAVAGLLAQCGLEVDAEASDCGATSGHQIGRTHPLHTPPHLPPHRTACDLGGAGLDRLRHPIHALTQPRRTRVWSVDVGGELLVEILWRNLGWDKIASLTHGFLVEVLSEGAGGGQGEFFGIGWAVVVVDRRLHRVVLVFVGAHDSSFIDGLVSGSEL